MKTFITLLLALRAASLDAQAAAPDAVDNRIAALNAVFAFRNDLGPGGTLIARCRIPTAHPDSGAVPGLDPRFQSLLARPASPRPPGMERIPCAAMLFADPKHRVLWLQELVTVTRTSSEGFLLPDQSPQFEITLQLIDGPGYREYHRYVVAPSGVNFLPDRSKRVTGWRVIEYRLAGMEFDWTNIPGDGSGVRVP